ncbi:MAG: HAD family hydrolase [Coprococcus sp.]
MKNIIFDIGMVLIDFHWESTMRKLGIPEDVIHHLDTHMINHPLWRHYDLNDMPENELIAQFKEISPQYSEYIDLFLNNLEDVIDMYEGADTWLKGLKEQGYNIYLLSNYPERMFNMHLKRYYFLPYVDGRVVSYEYGVVKPDPAIYNILCKKYNLIAEESVFLDDRKENVAAAEKLGFHTIHVTDPFAVREELRLLLLNN